MRKVYTAWLGSQQLITGSNLDVVLRRLEQRAKEDGYDISRYEIRIHYYKEHHYKEHL